MYFDQNITLLAGSILTVAGTLLAIFIQGKVDERRISGVHETAKSVKEDTADMRPKVNDIKQYTQDMMSTLHREVSPAMKKIDSIDQIVAHIDKEQAVMKAITPNMLSMDRMVAEVKALYEQNATLNQENIALKQDNQILEAKNRDLTVQNANLLRIMEQNERQRNQNRGIDLEF